MTDDLYFMRILASAFSEPAPAEAMQRALHDIVALKAQPDYQRGFAQFCQFMSEVASHLTVQFVVERENLVLATPTVHPFLDAVMVEPIVPGEYTLKLSTGLVVWRDVLSEEDLLWTSAFGGQELRLAADTAAEPRRFSRRESLLNGEIVLYVFPGVENGAIGIEIHVPANS